MTDLNKLDHLIMHLRDVRFFSECVIHDIIKARLDKKFIIPSGYLRAYMERVEGKLEFILEVNKS